MSGPNSLPEIGQQDYRTPKNVLAACFRRFDLKGFVWDYACSLTNCVGEQGGYSHPEVDALVEDWHDIAACFPEGTGFVNPPFAQSGAFAAKCAGSGARIVALVPVAIGTQWWKKHVHNVAHVVGVGRIVFDLPDGSGPVVGKNGKPQPINRDCALLAYNILPPSTPRYLLEDWRDW